MLCAPPRCQSRCHAPDSRHIFGNLLLAIYSASPLPSLPLRTKFWSGPPKQDRIINLSWACPTNFLTSWNFSISHRWTSGAIELMSAYFESLLVTTDVIL